MGGIVRFPRGGTPRSDERTDRESSSQAKSPVAALIRWSDLKMLHEGDDNGDGGGAAA